MTTKKAQQPAAFATSTVNKIMGNGMREYLHTPKKTITMKADVVSNANDTIKLKVYLNTDGYVIKFPSPPSIEAWFPTSSIKSHKFNLYVVDETTFYEVTKEPFEKYKQYLIIKHGFAPKLINLDMTEVYPLQ